ELVESAVRDKQHVNVNGDARWKSICFELRQTPDVVHAKSGWTISFCQASTQPSSGESMKAV
ncbi:hypothetical protein BKA82DRAFT_1000840, partial [Pisolithus tinctorius]